MTHTTDTTTVLTRRIAEILVATGDLRTSEEARVNLVAEEIREAESWAMRRAARHERDRACYRLGSALEPSGGLDLDDIALCGLDHLGAYGVVLLAEIARDHPGLTLSAMLRLLFLSEAGAAIRAQGVWRRWCWLADFYHAETAEFLASKKGRDPKQRWRGEKVTVDQEHLIREISRYLQIARPSFANRGLAFDWIRDAGGNPRFRAEPPCPPMPVVGSL